ncbi:MAG: rhodanese-like domain-containing protein [Ignavibacteriaceae bacterium]
MKINFSSAFYIIIVSSIIGLLINFLRKDGIQLSREETQMVWADSLKLIKNIDSNSIEIKQEKSPVKDSSSSLKEDLIPNSGTSKGSVQEPTAINLKQAYELFKKNIVFIDARENADYKEGHIKNSLNLPYYDFDSYKQILKDIPKSSIIVTYCAGTDCDLSILLGKQLFESGYKRVYIFFGGWNDWLNVNYPVEKS